MKRKLSVFLLAVVMLLSVCPIASVSAATPEVWLENVYVDGNMKSGETLTAQYTIPQECTEIDAAKTAASVVWYREAAQGKDGSKDASIGEGNVDSTTNPDDPRSKLTIDSTTYTEQTYEKPVFFFSVTPKKEDGTTFTDANGNTLTIWSTQTGTLKTSGSTAVAEGIYSLVIVPKKQPGTMNPGDEVFVSYSRVNGSAGTFTVAYEWYTSDTYYATAANMETAFADVDPLDRDMNYTIANSDAGKWLYAKVTPSLDGVAGTAKWARNHVGNVMLSGLVENIANSTNFGRTYYPNAKILGDGMFAPSSNYGANTLYLYNKKTSPVSVTFDAGEIVPFDGMFFRMNRANASNVTNVSPVFSYSLDNETWYNAVVQSNVGHADLSFPCNEVKYARYFKLDVYATISAVSKAMVNDFYPYLSSSARPVSVLAAEAANYEAGINKITVKKTGKTLANVAAALEAKDYSGNNLTLSFVTATVDNDGGNSTDGFTTSGYLVDPVALADTTPVDANLVNTYLKATDANGKITYYEIAYEPEFDMSAVVVDSKVATVGENVSGDKILTVNAWGTPKSALESAISITGGTFSFVDSNNAAKGDFVVTEDLTDTYMRVVSNGIPATFEVKYAGHLTSWTGTTYSWCGNASLAANSVFAPAATVVREDITKSTYNQIALPNSTGKYLMKASVSVTAATGETKGIGFVGHMPIRNDTDNTNFYYDMKVLRLAVDKGNKVYLINENIAADDADTKYNFVRATHGSSPSYVWYDVEILWDFSTTRSAGGLYETKASAWVNGAKVLDNAWLQHSGNFEENSTYFSASIYRDGSQLKSGSGNQRNYISNITFREVYDKDTHVVTENPYNFTLGGVASGTTVAAGAEATLATTSALNFYYGETDGYTNFLVEYTTDANGKTVVEQVKSAVGAWPTITPTAAGNTIKAFSFDTDYLVPNVNVGEWTVVAAQ